MANLNVLHICNDFLGSKVYGELYGRLEALGFKQTVYVPLRKSTSSKFRQRAKSCSEYLVVGSPLLRGYHKYLFGLKRRFLFKNLASKINLKDVDIVHATTLFSDGALALDVFRRYGIPYVVTVRITDISTFFRYRRDLFGLAEEIIQHAHYVIFVSESLKSKLFEPIRFNKIQGAVAEKCVVIPNGVNDIWLNNIYKKKVRKPHNIIYVGSLSKRKNITGLIKAVLDLKADFPDLSITVVGSGGNAEDDVKLLAEKYPRAVRLLGKVDDPDKLIEIYREHEIFAMPSFNETFGLVYIEALTQGLPVLYSKNEGVDGFLPSLSGISVDPHDFERIKLGLREIIESYDVLSTSGLNYERFSWDNIAIEYNRLYLNTVAGT